MSPKTQVLNKIELSLSYYLPEDFHIVWPKRLRAESTHPENWPKRPTYQGRNDPPPKLAETTQAETTQAETTQGRNDPDSLVPYLEPLLQHCYLLTTVGVYISDIGGLTVFRYCLLTQCKMIHFQSIIFLFNYHQNQNKLIPNERKMFDLINKTLK